MNRDPRKATFISEIVAQPSNQIQPRTRARSRRERDKGRSSSIDCPSARGGVSTKCLAVSVVKRAASPSDMNCTNGESPKYRRTSRLLMVLRRKPAVLSSKPPRALIGRFYSSNQDAWCQIKIGQHLHRTFAPPKAIHRACMPNSNEGRSKSRQIVSPDD
jgi:hypothetical protein